MVQLSVLEIDVYDRFCSSKILPGTEITPSDVWIAYFFYTYRLRRCVVRAQKNAFNSTGRREPVVVT